MKEEKETHKDVSPAMISISPSQSSLIAILIFLSPRSEQIHYPKNIH